MSTICFDLQRLDNNYIAIKHVKFGTSEYNYHRALHFTNHTNKVKKNWWLEDRKYRYIWVVIGYRKEGYEEICFVCNDKVWANQVCRDMLKPKKDYFTDKLMPPRYTSVRISKIPFDRFKGWSLDKQFRLWEENDLGDEFVLYVPENINKEDFE